MKPLFICSVLLAGAFLACSEPAAQEKKVPSQLKKEDTMSATEKNKAVIRSIYECLNNRSYEQLRQYIADDYTGPGGYGADHFLTPVRPLIAAFPDIRWSIEDLVAEGDKVTVRWRWKGMHSGAFYGVEATHREFTNDAIAIYQLRDGRAVNAWMQTDRLGFLIQLGLVSQSVIPAPPAPVK